MCNFKQTINLQIRCRITDHKDYNFPMYIVERSVYIILDTLYIHIYKERELKELLLK